MHPTLPKPLDDPESNLLECPTLNWGILGCGRVSHDFCQALKLLPTQSVVACSARTADSAGKFAEKHKIGKSYGSYDQMLKDPEIEIVYVGNIHSNRREIGEKCLLNSKHVLIEKPFACSVKDGEYLISLAKVGLIIHYHCFHSLNILFLQFFPAVQKARDLATGSEKVLGEIAAVNSDFNFNAADSDAYPSSFLYQRKLGGGANLLVAPYPIAAASMFFDGRMPADIKAVGQVDTEIDGRMPEDIKAVGQVDTEMEVELQAAVVLSFSPTDNVKPTMESGKDDNSPGNVYPKLPGSGVATLSYGFLCETPEETVIVGSKGRMKIQSPSHCPTKLSVELKAAGRGKTDNTLNFEYPLPEDTKDIISSGGYFYPNSAGFIYEAAAVARCIAAGKTQRVD
eukprot:CAMPEP_0170890290 /NCGR_PEP_ID=MMETSP0734-20130129/40000_1 /TAXON_ID=186038 /ORGANISM="Fragilariopsis kerguelensis, Strain L26-C5" /LENGTH=397 /DNA_ID=CAMNT_0011279091 /DNA_START=515 /DNA_END=1709 /DNA_ORIENTATION=-